jgi:endo-beta-N-acetylglucosaminidase D
MPKFIFAISLIFEEDEAILDYLVNTGNERAHRAPPDVDGVEKF